jgi:DNA-binding GntR family transcriptional regulator
LSRRYRLGHAPLRSALQRLVEQGLVTNRRRLGHVVTPITVRDIRDIFHLRRILEPVAVELAVGRISQRQLIELRESCSTTYSYDPKEREKNVAFLTANRAFCVAIARSCGNDRLCAAIEHLQDLTLRILYLGLHPKLGDEDAGFQANSATLDALIAGNAQEARELYAKSLEISERCVLSSILDLPKFQEMNVAQIDIT